MIILSILSIAVLVGIVQGIRECIRNPIIFSSNELESSDHIKLLDERKNELENKLELIESQIDILHELNQSINKQLDGYINEKQRTQLLNKKAVTVGKLEMLQDKQNKIINELDEL
jgi:hypothetical protein